ncbi:lipid II-degrading bacteriocin [Pseudomonas sp. NPDC089554]|uniref:lipid II-degrading bacteriocin n=1 Tax=Pseudomonas sp. NPDC089554 TaxID=3390653 RepID=UPI003CFC5F08
MSNELAESVVYGEADPHTTYTIEEGWDSVFAMLPEHIREIHAIPLAAPALVLNGEAVWAAALAANPYLMMQEICKGLSNQPLFSVRTQLGIHTYANYMWGENGPAAGKYLFPLDGSFDLQYGYGQFLATNNWIDAPLFAAHSVDFFGVPTMPFAAMGYWLFGNGLPRYVDVRSLNLAMGVSDFGPINQILTNPDVGEGVYQVSEAPFSYNTFNSLSDLPVALTVGRVSGKVTGDLTVHADGSYYFSGYYNLNDDKFDADPSNRPWLQEALTTFLMQLGETFGHTDYTIHFQGDQPISFEGER